MQDKMNFYFSMPLSKEHSKTGKKDVEQGEQMACIIRRISTIQCLCLKSLRSFYKLHSNPPSPKVFSSNILPQTTHLQPLQVTPNPNTSVNKTTFRFRNGKAISSPNFENRKQCHVRGSRMYDMPGDLRNPITGDGNYGGID